MKGENLIEVTIRGAIEDYVLEDAIVTGVMDSTPYDFEKKVRDTSEFIVFNSPDLVSFGKHKDLTEDFNTLEDFEGAYSSEIVEAITENIGDNLDGSCITDFQLEKFGKDGIDYAVTYEMDFDLIFEPIKENELELN